jgi:predicted ATPase
MEEHFFAAELHRLRGETLLEIGDDQQGEAALECALTIAQRQAARLWELRAGTSLARFWLSRGKSERARNLLEPIYGWFTEGFEMPDLKRARATLAELH